MADPNVPILQRPAGVARRADSETGHPRRAAPRPLTVVIANSYKRARRSIDPPSQLRSLKDTNVVHAETDVDMTVGESEAAAWTAALLPLVKGKTTMDEAKMVHTSDALSEVERANERGIIPPGVLKESALADTVRRLGELEDVPLGDVYGLRKRARTLAERWREMFGEEVVDLQRSIFLHAS
ncbi:hypothetical protein BJV78DRAFT_552845 [Lactifluus subvellereus]|nr:hypothetical protein BJV78DRAFT_552845 [Lactifluus subvellereus]